MLLGGGGSLGGGGKDITGGLDLSIDASIGPLADGTRERLDNSSLVPEEMSDSIDCRLSEAVFLRPMVPCVEGSRNTLDLGVGTGDGAVKTGPWGRTGETGPFEVVLEPVGGGTNWN